MATTIPACSKVSIGVSSAWTGVTNNRDTIRAAKARFIVIRLPLSACRFKVLPGTRDQGPGSRVQGPVRSILQMRYRPCHPELVEQIQLHLERLATWL